MGIRIISGEYRGRRLSTLRGDATRPTADRVRESVFNILGRRTAGAAAADLFAGSGALGLEAVSRGAASCVFVEKSAPAMAVIRKNIDLCGAGERCRVIRWDAVKNLNCLKAEEPFLDLVFMDPPYAASAVHRTLTLLHGAGALKPGAMVVAEHGEGGADDAPPDGFAVADLRQYGKSLVTFFGYML